MYARGWSRLVYGPHENQRVTAGSAARSRSAGASPAFGSRSVSVGPCSAMLALLYDIHGNLPALEAVLDDTAGRGVDRWLLGGDMAPFGAWPAETVHRLRELENAEWIRGNTERWMVDPIPAVEPMSVAVQACRDALGYAVADELGALPESAALADTVTAWHGSPVSDMQSFLPEPGDDEDELLIGVTDSRLFFGHTHLQFRRTAEGPNGPVELVNPGSVGIPLDGDHRAAYALVDDDGNVEFRRVEYDWRASAQALRDKYGDPEWVGIVTGRIERAKLNAD
jgi:predicted phosphodiesterase